MFSFEQEAGFGDQFTIPEEGDAYYLAKATVNDVTVDQIHEVLPIKC